MDIWGPKVSGPVFTVGESLGDEWQCWNATLAPTVGRTVSHYTITVGSLSMTVITIPAQCRDTATYGRIASI